MSVTTTKTKISKSKAKVSSDFTNESLEYQGKPVYYYRSMIFEMSLCGSDLMVESL